MSYENVPEWIKKVPDQYKAQEMCNKAASMDSLLLRFVPDRFKTQKMCIKAAEVDLSFLQLVLDHFKTEEMCNKAAYNFHGCLVMSLIFLRPGRCAMTQWIGIYAYWSTSLICL